MKTLNELDNIAKVELTKLRVTPEVTHLDIIQTKEETWIDGFKRGYICRDLESKSYFIPTNNR